MNNNERPNQNFVIVLPKSKGKMKQIFHSSHNKQHPFLMPIVCCVFLCVLRSFTHHNSLPIIIISSQLVTPHPHSPKHKKKYLFNSSIVVCSLFFLQLPLLLLMNWNVHSKWVCKQFPTSSSHFISLRSYKSGSLLWVVEFSAHYELNFLFLVHQRSIWIVVC